MHRGMRNVLSMATVDRKRGHGLNCGKGVLGCCTDKSNIKEGETLKLVT